MDLQDSVLECDPESLLTPAVFGLDATHCKSLPGGGFRSAAPGALASRVGEFVVLQFEPAVLHLPPSWN